MTTNYQKEEEKTQHCRGAVGTCTRAVACALASQPQPLLCAHPSMLSHGHKNLQQRSAPEFVGSASGALLLPLGQRLVALLGEIVLHAVAALRCHRQDSRAGAL